MAHDCELHERPTQATLAVRTRSPVQNLPQVFGRIYGEIGAYLGELGEEPSGMPYAAYRNMDMQDLDLEIGMPVGRELPGRGDIQPGHLPGNRWASLVHVGPYDQVGPAYEVLGKWVTDQGLEATGVAYEFFFSGPETPPEQIKTEIAFPLKD